MARRVLVLAGLAAAQVGDMREYFVGDGVDRLFVEVGWTEDAAAAVTPACEKVYAGGTVQECVAMMVAHIERDRTLSIEIMVDGAQAVARAVLHVDLLELVRNQLDGLGVGVVLHLRDGHQIAAGVVHVRERGVGLVRGDAARRHEADVLGAGDLKVAVVERVEDLAEHGGALVACAPGNRTASRESRRWRMNSPISRAIATIEGRGTGRSIGLSTMTALVGLAAEAADPIFVVELKKKACVAVVVSARGRRVSCDWRARVLYYSAHATPRPRAKCVIQHLVANCLLQVTRRGKNLRDSYVFVREAVPDVQVLL
jgi:hypothetical protein